MKIIHKVKTAATKWIGKKIQHEQTTREFKAYSISELGQAGKMESTAWM